MITSRFLLPVLLAFAPLAQAKLKLPALMGDHMVIQAEAKTNVWGWAAPGEKISVSFAGQKAAAEAGKDGKWSARLADLKAGTAGDLTIKGEDEIVIKDVLVGEVWVASGQSNMEFTLKGARNAEAEIAEANFPQVRMFTVVKAFNTEPQENCAGSWQICTPQTAPAFSAVGYFFARDLHQKLKVPVGVIHTSWGGTPAEYWTPPDILASDDAFKGFIDEWEQVKAKYPAAKAKFDEATEKWKAAVEQAKAGGKPAPRAPSAPRGGDAFGGPGCLWNAMIVPVLPYTIQGTIWYQGESNANGTNATLYRVLFPTMIMSWRQAWARQGLKGSDNPDFPFLFVQLANYRQRYPDPWGSDWAVLRESQLRTLELPRTGMAVIIDIGEGGDIHPKNKQDVGLRLALSALAQVYYVDTEFSGPIISGWQEEDTRIRLSFRNADGLKAREGGKIVGFAAAGEDKKFYWADASIEGDHVLISSPQVPKPVAIRYAWADNPECNLVNSAGLPASPFRTDDWPQQFPPVVPVPVAKPAAPAAPAPAAPPAPAK